MNEGDKPPFQTCECRKDRNNSGGHCWGLLHFCHIKWKYFETGPPAYRPYLRRRENLIIYRCQSNVTTFSLVILKPWVLVRLGIEPRPYRSKVWFSTEWGIQSAECSMVVRDDKLANQPIFYRNLCRGQIDESLRSCMKEFCSKQRYHYWGQVRTIIITVVLLPPRLLFKPCVV